VIGGRASLRDWMKSPKAQSNRVKPTDEMMTTATRQMDLEDRLPNTLRLEDECRGLLVRLGLISCHQPPSTRARSASGHVSIHQFCFPLKPPTTNLQPPPLSMQLNVHPHPPKPTSTPPPKQELQVYEVEMPGQYLAGKEVTPENSVYLEHISSDVAVVRRNSGCFRCGGLGGGRGRSREWGGGLLGARVK
jgi:hypothetical protein